MTARTSPEGHVGTFDLLNRHAQEALRARVAAADGDIERVRQEVQAHLDALDSSASSAEGPPPAYQADRAFFVGQIAYLTLLAREQAAANTPEKQGFLARLQSLWRPGRARR